MRSTTCDGIEVTDGGEWMDQWRPEVDQTDPVLTGDASRNRAISPTERESSSD
jgi:hypothetical protein